MASILLVEDDKAIIENLKEFLAAEGFDVKAVSGQTEAVGILEEEAFDLALLDISLAEGNGFAVCAYMKQNTDIPVIFLTASGDEYSVVSGLDMGADDYISKPFRPRELVSRRFFSLRWNIGFCLCFSIIRGCFSAESACWKRYGTWRANLSMIIPLLCILSV